MVDYILTREERALLRQMPQSLKRYICYAPRSAVWFAVADGAPSLDPDSGGIFQLNYRSDSGDFSAVQIDLTMDVGTVPGGHDVGSFRLRSAPAVGTLYVNETAFATTPVADGHYLTVYNEHRPWRKRIRRKIAGSGVDYEEFIEYNGAYGGENEDFMPPVANISRDHNPYHQVRCAAFVPPGEEEASFDLSSFLSFAPGPFPIVEPEWHVFDGTIVSGGVHTADIRVTFPPGYREIFVSIVTDRGFAKRYYSIWVFADENDENLITGFSVDTDERQEGRSMSFTIWDDRARNITEGMEVCYFEVPTFPGDAAIPPLYISHFIGWAMDDATTLRLYKSVYKLTVGGPQSWMNITGGYAQTVYDPRWPDTPTAHATKFSEMAKNKPDKMVHYVTRYYSNILLKMNLYFSDYQPDIEGYDSDNGTLWSQVVAVPGRYFGVAACDSMGSLFLTRHYSYREQSERDLMAKIDLLTNADWPDASAPTVNRDHSHKTKLVDVYGSNFDILIDSGGHMIDFSHLWRANAPGIVEGDGPDTETPTEIFLQKTQAGQTQLLQLSGHHLARKNNEIPDFSVPLRANMDIFEPAWGLATPVTYTDDTASGLSLIAQDFVLKSVSVQHSNEIGKQRKVITPSFEMATIGRPGINVDAPQRVDNAPYPIPVLSKGTKAIGGITRDRKLYIIKDVDTDTPSTTMIDISSVIAEDVAFFVPDPFSPYYLGQGPEVNVRLITEDGKIYDLLNVGMEMDTQLRFTPPLGAHGEIPSAYFIQFERGQKNYGVATYTPHGTGGSILQPHVVVTLDGTSWTDYTPPFGVGGGQGSIDISPHDGTIRLISSSLPTPDGHLHLALSTDFGADFATNDVPHIIDLGAYFHIPFQSIDGSTVYSIDDAGNVRRSIGAVDTDVTPHFTGKNLNPANLFELKSCDVDMNTIFMVAPYFGAMRAEAAYYSTNQGDTWSLLSFDTSNVQPYACNIAGDNPRTVFAWGVDYLGWTPDISQPIASKGTITGLLLNIFGMPNS